MQFLMFIRLNNKNSDLSFRVNIREHVSLTVRKLNKAASNVISINYAVLYEICIEAFLAAISDRGANRSLLCCSFIEHLHRMQGMTKCQCYVGSGPTSALRCIGTEKQIYIGHSWTVYIPSAPEGRVILWYFSLPPISTNRNYL